MKEDFVSYDIAVKLKEKGFKYNKMNLIDKICMENQINNPTIFQSLKWLREEKKLFVEPYLFKDGYESFVQSVVFEDGKDYTDMWRVEGFYPTYEQAALAGIEYVIDNLI